MALLGPIPRRCVNLPPGTLRANSVRLNFCMAVELSDNWLRALKRPVITDNGKSL